MTNMKRIRPVSVLFFCAAVLFVAAKSRAEDDQKKCTMATLRGTYLVSGRADKAPDDPATNYPRYFAGLYTFDGQGNIYWIQTSSSGGQIHRRQIITGVYSVDSDCTGTVYVKETAINWDLFVSEDGSEANLIRTDKGSIANRTLKRTKEQ